MLDVILKLNTVLARTRAYRGKRYSFRAQCAECEKVVNTSSQVFLGRERDELEAKNCRDWIVLCYECGAILWSGIDLSPEARNEWVEARKHISGIEPYVIIRRATAQRLNVVS